MEFSAYADLNGINFSTLREMDRSPRHYQHRLTHPRADSAAMRLGRATHMATLEPDAFPLNWTLYEGRRAGNVWETFAEVNADKSILGVEEYETALAIRDSVRSHKTAKRLLRWGKPEVSLRWIDKSSRMRLKSRLDWVAPQGTLVDLKTSRDIEPRTFGRTAANFLYHAQMSFYRRALVANGYPPGPVYIIAVESQAPFDCMVYEVDEDVLFAGDELVTKLLHQVKTCRRRYGKRTWPGRDHGIQTLDFPSWALPSDNDLSGLGIAFQTVGGTT